MISGESGSGKESFSKIIHQLSTRKHGQFIAINCGAIPEGTIDSELFGHEKGSFTGAHEARKGYFEVTNGGTIFLDEIGEMPLGTQARLLRMLENKEFIRVGSSKVQKADVRVVAASNVNLLEAVERGKFREDLYYRLNTVPIYVPPLRERGEDVVLLFRKFADDFSEKYRVKPIKLLDDAKELLMKFRFPGNIRQLKNIVEQISVLQMNREIDAEDLRKYLPENQYGQTPALFRMAGTNNDGNISERDLLYKILFDLKKDVNDLKKIVFENMQKDTFTGSMINEYPAEVEKTLTPDIYTPQTFAQPAYYINQGVPKAVDPKTIDITRVEDIAEAADESFSLEQKEKEMIIKALKKNNHKRKYAAQDLGISERTLYRKIKQYGIDEE